MTERRWTDETTSPLEARAAKLLKDGDAGAAILHVAPRGERSSRPYRPLRMRALIFAVLLSASVVAAAVSGVRALVRISTPPPAPPAALPSKSTPSALEREAELLRRALEALAQKDAERALLLLGSIEPRTSELAVDRVVVEARALSMLGRYDEALVRFEALSRERLTPGLMLLWADAFVHQGRCASARQVLLRLEGQALSPEEESTRVRLLARCGQRRDKR